MVNLIYLSCSFILFYLTLPNILTQNSGEELLETTSETNQKEPNRINSTSSESNNSNKRRKSIC